MRRPGVRCARLLATRPCRIVARVVGGTWNDGFMHAGNLAYLSLLTLFPFFIVVATVAGALGRTDDGLHAVSAFLRTVPPDVGTLIAKPIHEVLAARSQKGLLTLGIVVTLWTVSGLHRDDPRDRPPRLWHGVEPRRSGNTGWARSR